MSPGLELGSLELERGGRAILRGIDLVVPRGQWLALLGENGSGKTSLLEACWGRLPGVRGRIRVAGHDLAADPLACRSRLGVAMPAERLPPLLTGHECLAIMAAARGLAAAGPEVLALASALSLSSLLEGAVALMSYGSRQKLGILLALVGAPPLLLLDESLNGLDPRSSRVLKEHLKDLAARGTSVVLATHALDVALEWVDRSVLLHAGRLCGDWPAERLRANGGARELEHLLEAASARKGLPPTG